MLLIRDSDIIFSLQVCHATTIIIVNSFTHCVTGMSSILFRNIFSLMKKHHLSTTFCAISTVSDDYFSNPTEDLVLTPSDPRDCIFLFIVNDAIPEGTEVISASFEQQIDGVTVTEVTEICIVDDDEG